MLRDWQFACKQPPRRWLVVRSPREPALVRTSIACGVRLDLAAAGRGDDDFSPLLALAGRSAGTHQRCDEYPVTATTAQSTSCAFDAVTLKAAPWHPPAPGRAHEG
jgi:hypothetical protein